MKYNLSEVLELIKERRTIYPELYSQRVIHKEIIENILRSATWAPTHGQTQPWRFQVFMDAGKQKLGTALADAYKQWAKADFNEGKFERFSARAAKSQCMIAVNMKRQESGRIPEIEEIQAVSAAIQNMLLTATAYGIGSFWSTPQFVASPEFKSFLKLEEDDKCLGILYFGYTNEDWPKGQRKPIEYLTDWITE